MTTASISLAVLGKQEFEAIKMIEEAGFKARIIARDGKVFIVTMDFRPGDRINISIIGGVVVEASPG